MACVQQVVQQVAQHANFNPPTNQPKMRSRNDKVVIPDYQQSSIQDLYNMKSWPIRPSMQPHLSLQPPPSQSNANDIRSRSITVSTRRPLHQTSTQPIPPTQTQNRSRIPRNIASLELSQIGIVFLRTISNENIQDLRRLNETILPVKYTDNFYNDVANVHSEELSCIGRVATLVILCYGTLI